MQRLLSEPLRFWIVVVVGLLVSIVLVSCSETGGSRIEEQSLAMQLEPPEFERSMESGDAFVLNVHTPDEGSLPGADAAIPFDELQKRASELPVSRETKMVVYCRSGRMSRTAVKTLAEMGYTKLVELRGGMSAWRESGRPLLPASRNSGRRQPVSGIPPQRQVDPRTQPHHVR